MGRKNKKNKKMKKEVTDGGCLTSEETVAQPALKAVPLHLMESNLGAIKHILMAIGEDTNREGLRDTPSRVVKSWAQLFSGYKQDPMDHMKVFKDGACDEMVILKDIEFYSTCEHHMIPFYGKAHIAYVPNGKVIGVSKLARILDVFARRLQIQERIGSDVTAILMKGLNARGAACIIEAKHLCMCARGVEKQNSVMVTSSLTGCYRDSFSGAREELMQLIKN